MTASADGSSGLSTSTEIKAPKRAWQRRVVALLLGLLLIPVVAELGLWAASLFARPEARLVELAPRPGERRILCIGDSHTYGSHLTPEESYPGQLQTFLDRAPNNPWKVINLGFPGQNSAEVRLRFARNIAVYKPEIVVCWVGANNTWSLEQSHLWDHPHEEVAAPLGRGLLQRLRVVGLARMLLRRWHLSRLPHSDALEVETDREAVPGLDGAKRGGGVGSADPPVSPTDYIAPQEEVRRGLFIDLARILELSREQGATLVLSEYPVSLPETRANVNRLLRQFSRQNGLTFVPIARVVVPLSERLGFDKVWFPDFHCRALGNYEVARTILSSLIGAGLIDGLPEYQNVEPVEAMLGGGGLSLVKREGDRVDIEVFGPPLANFRIGAHLLLGGPGEEPAAWGSSASRALFTPEQREAASGRLSPAGRARVTVSLPTRAQADELGVPADIPLWGWRLSANFSVREANVEASRVLDLRFRENAQAPAPDPAAREQH